MIKNLRWKLFFINNLVLIHSTGSNLYVQSTISQTIGHQSIKNEFSSTILRERSNPIDNFLNTANTSMGNHPDQMNKPLVMFPTDSYCNESGFVSRLICDETILSSSDSINPTDPIAHSTPIINKIESRNHLINIEKTTSSQCINQLECYGYTEISYISRGGEGYVYKVSNYMKKKIMAVKVFINDRIDLYSVFDEIIVRKNLNHLYILDFTLIINFNLIFMEMDYYEFDLDTYKNKFDLNQLDCKIILKQIIDGLYHIHSSNVIHNDIKPANILINKSLDIKIADFGIACLKDRLIFPFKSVESLEEYKTYSPELKKNIPYTDKSDIYSFGILIYYLYLGRYNLNQEGFDVLGEDAKKLLATCINEKSEKRMSAEQLKMHEYFDLLYSDLFCFSKLKDFQFTSDAGINIEKNGKKLTIKGENFEYKVYCCCCDETIQKYAQVLDRLKEIDNNTQFPDYISKIRFLVIVNNNSEIIQSILKPKLENIKKAFICISKYQESLDSSDRRIDKIAIMRTRKRKIKYF